MKENTRNLGDIVGSLLLILSGIGIVIGAIKLNVGSPLDPQPGFFPFLWGILLIGLSSIIMIHGWLGRGKKTEGFGEIRRPAVLVAGIGVYVGIFDLLGYVLATFLIAAFILRVLGVKSWKVLGLSGIALSVGAYLLFDWIMGVELPAGILKTFR